jgi:hypothetical protein
MATLAGIFDLSTERLTSFELPGKKAIVLLRWTLFVSLLGLGATSSQGILSTFLVHLILGIFLAVNLLLSILPADTFRATHLEFSLGLIDTALISYVVYESDHTGYLCLFFFVLLISTAALTRIGQILLGALSLSTLYLLVSSIRDGPSVLLSIPHLMVIPLFYATALYFGYQVLQIRGRHAKVNHLDRERQELRIVLNTLESVTSSLDFHHVMFQITSRIADAVDAVSEDQDAASRPLQVPRSPGGYSRQESSHYRGRGEERNAPALPSRPPEAPLPLSSDPTYALP